MSKTIAKKKNAILAFLITYDIEILSSLLEFGDDESNYKGFRNEKNKTPYEMLSVIFSGSYNRGEACVSEKYIPYVITEKNGDYAITAKENWQKHFPTVIILQRAKTIDKSILDKYLVASTRHLKSTSSSTSSLRTPTVSTSSSSSSPWTRGDYFQEDKYSFESYKSGAALDNSEIPMDEVNSFESFMGENTMTNVNEVSVNAVDNSAVYEYTTSNNMSEGTGLAVIKRIDNSELEFEFDMAATLLNPRVFKGACGTHRWKAYKEKIVQDKLDIKVGDYIIVKGITDSGKIHIADPAYIASNMDAMRTYTVNADIFTSNAVLALSPESL